MSTPTPEFPTPDAARTDRRLLYAIAATVVVGALAIAAVIVLTPNHHHALVDGPINGPTQTSPAPAASPTPSPSPATSPSPASPSPATPATSVPPTTAAPTSAARPGPTPITHTAPATRNPVIPATLSPLEQSAAQAYINFVHVENQVWDDNSADMEVFNDVAEGDELKQLVDLTVQGRAQGLVSRGYPKVTKIFSVTLSQDQQTATVSACLDATPTSTIVEKTGEVVGHGGPPYVAVIYMHLGADGVWRTPGRPPNQGGQPC